MSAICEVLCNDSNTCCSEVQCTDDSSICQLLEIK